MSGDPILIVNDAAGTVATFVEALAGFPPELPPVAVVGGFAVFVRLARAHRATADLDTVTPGQGVVVEILASSDEGERHAAGRVRFRGVVVDVMQVPAADAPVPTNGSDRAFHLVRGFALASAVPEEVRVVDRDGAVITSATSDVATAGALMLLKAVALPRRPLAKRAKAASDALDLVRLAGSHEFDVLMEQVADAPGELVSYAASELVKRFASEHDGGYTLARLRALNLGFGVEADDLERVAEVGRRVAALPAFRPVPPASPTA